MRLGSLAPGHAVLASIRPVSASAVAAAPSHGDDEITAVRRTSVLTLRPTSRGKIIGNHSSIRAVLQTIDRIARSTCTVLVTGESGTGKELVVAALHDASTRRNGPLVTINCGAIPAELVESELFGHAKGAFTGAQNARRGHVANAEGGTLFLDEVGELPLAVQVKLLRILQQREYTPVGESRAVKADVRIVAATNRDLAAEVKAGRFREDLYYRLNVIHLHLPALRERGSDVRILATHFYRSCVESSGRDDLRGISEQALAAIEAHPWPGNVRALENAVERGVLLAVGPMVEAEDVLGAGAAVEGRPAIQLRPDPRREPESRRFGAFPGGGFPAPAALTGNGPPSSRRHPFAMAEAMRAPVPVAVAPQAISAPAKLATIEVVAPIKDPAGESVLQVGIAGEQRRGSNPSFPRMLPDVGVDLFSAVESYQNNLIRQALLRTGGNKNRAAQLLGLNRTTLVEMIRRRGL